ncbi:MAG: Ig-like domain-containing protein [Xanthomonadales bacterium]|nr:Ig-like domain-containing protein [Xanthomonadales bacterium]
MAGVRRVSILLFLMGSHAAQAGAPPCERIFAGGFEDAPAPTGLVADAGPDQTITPGAAAALDGSASSDGNFCWALIARPAGSSAELTDARSATPTLLTDLAGDYRVSLQVTDSAAISASDEVLISSSRIGQDVGAGGGVVISPDGLVTLDIPPGALSQTTRITIRKLMPQDLDADLAAAGPLASYEFGPDGLQFSQPVGFTAEIDSQIPGAPPATMTPATLVTQAEGPAEVLNNVANQMGSGRMTISGELTHFSRFALLPFSRVVITPDQRLFGLVGGPVTGRYRVSIQSTELSPISVSTQTAQPPLLLPASSLDPLLDNLAHSTPIDLKFPTQNHAVGEFSAQCRRAGVGEVRVSLTVSGALLVSLPGLLNLGPTPVTVGIPVRCFAPLVLALPVARDDAVQPPAFPAARMVAVLANDTTTGIDLATLRVERAPLSGSTQVNPDGTITYTPSRPVFFDRFDYSFRTTGGIRSNTATVFLSASATPNNPPQATPDQADTVTDQPVTLSILANDSDSDGTLDPASVALNLAGTLGQVVLNPDGSVTYTPPPLFTGTDGFQYRVDDDDGATSNSVPVTVSVNPEGLPPRATADQFNLLADTPEDLSVLANDSGDFSVASLAIVQPPNFGTAEIRLTQTGTTQKGSASAPGSIDAFVRYTPNAGYLGNDFFVYSITDPDGNQLSQANVSLSIAPANNQPPVASDDAASTLPNQPVTVFVTANDFDPDSLLDVNSIQVLDAPANGSVFPAGAGAFQYLPGPGFVGIDTFTYDVADAFGARSNVATVSIAVAPPQNLPPTAQDDGFTLAIDSEAISFNVIDNDSDPDSNLDPASVAVVRPPASGGTAIANVDGSISVQLDPGFAGSFDFDYTIRDELGAESNAATVTLEVRQFLGADLDPTDNVSAAQVTFISFFGNGVRDLGDGSAAGVSHNSGLPDNLVPIADYTHLFKIVNSDPGVDTTFDFFTDQQSFSATYDDSNPDFARYFFDNLQPGPTFDDVSGSVLEVSGMNLGSRTIAVPEPLRDAGGQVINRFGEFNGLATPVIIPTSSGATHLLVRIVGRTSIPGVVGVVARIPLSGIPLNGDGHHERPMLDATARATLAALSFKATGQVLVILYNQSDSSEFFTFPGARTVPLAAGRGYSVPPDQLNARPDQCAKFRRNTLCQGGPKLRILATNRNGNLEMFDPENGNFLGRLVGENAPNFAVEGSANRTIQDRNNCLLMIDTGNIESGFVHRYDTDGSLLDGRFISIPRPNGAGTQPVSQVVGIGQRDGEVLVVVSGLGEIRRYDPDNGSLLGTIASDLIRPDAVYVDVDGDLLVTEQGPTGTQDQVYRYPADGSARELVIDGMLDLIGLGTPYQISRLQDGTLGLANFGGNAIRIFQEGFNLIDNLVIGNNPSGDPYLPRGVWPLNNGAFLISANNGGGVSVFDPFGLAGGGVQVQSTGSTFAKFGTACMP